MDRLYKTLTGILLGIVVLLLLLQVVILLPPVQGKLKSLVISNLQEQFHADVTIEKFSLGFPKKLTIHQLLVSEPAGDTLIYAGKFSINVRLLPLLRKKIIVQNIELEKVKGDIGKVIDQLGSGVKETTSAQPEPSDSSQTGWKFGVQQLNLSDVDLSFRDESAGFDLEMDIGTMQLHLGDVNLDSLIYCKSVAIANTTVSFEMMETEEVSVEDTSSTSFANIKVGEVKLENVGFTLIDSIGDMMLYTHAGKLSTSDNFVDITHAVIAVDEVNLKDAYCDIDFLPAGYEEADTATSSETGLDWGQYLWRITGNFLKLENCRYSMDYLDKEELQGHFDPYHMYIYEASGEISDFILDDGTLIAKLDNFKAKEDNGFEITDMGMDLQQHSHNYMIKGLHVSTPETNLFLDVTTKINPTDFSSLAEKHSDLKLNLNSLGAGDIDFFYPLFGSFTFLSRQNLQKNISLDLAFNGSMHQIDLQNFDFRFSDDTRVTFHGIVKHLDHLDSISFQLHIPEMATSKNEVYSVYPDLKNDSTFTLPEFVSLQADVAGGMKQQQISGELKSTAGNIRIDTLIVNLSGTPFYAVKIKSGLHHLTDILDYGIENADFELEASFTGSDLYQSEGNIYLEIDSLIYLQKKYQELKMEGLVKNGILTADLFSADTNLSFGLAVRGALSEIKKSLEAQMEVRKIDLQRLGLYPDPFSLNTIMEVKITYENPEKISIMTDIHSLDFHFLDTLYKMHPVNLTFGSDTNLTDVHLESFYYHLDFECRDDYHDFISAALHLPGYYLSDTTINSKEFYFPDFSLEGKLEYPEAFARLFFPDLPAFSELKIGGHYSEGPDELVFNASLLGVEYGSMSADSLGISVKGNSTGLKYGFISDFKLDDLVTGKFNVSGTFENSMLISRLRYTDSFANPYLDFTLHLDTTGKSIVIKFIEDSLIFSYDKWEISPDNRVEINPEYVAFTNLKVTSDDQVIQILSPDVEKPQDINLILKNFRMGSIEQLLALDTLVSGTANADFHLDNLFESPLIEGKLTIDDMSLMDFEMGKFNLSNFKSGDGQMIFDLTLKGEHEDIAANGVYLAASTKNPLDFNLSINQLDISELNYILSDFIFDAKGNLFGDLRITGTQEQPVMNGSVQFSDAGVGIRALNNYFTLGDQSVLLTENILQFNDFTIRNKKDESARIIGTISLGSTNKTYHNLRIITDNMEIMNATRKDNDILFGLLKAKADIEIKGTSGNISVNAEVKVDKSTDVTYIFPDNLALDDNEGIVQFGRYDPETLTDEDIRETGSFFGMQALNNFKSRIEIEEGSKFNLYFDNSGENFLKASLNGFINYNLVEQNSEVSGTFGVMGGTLHYSIPMVAVDDYEIEPGSYITLSNDLYNPYLNIVASSSVRASTEGLMASNTKVMTFKLLLYMEGELNDVSLRFDISTETTDALVSARLAQLTEEERNVNALNLLVRGSFLISLSGNEVGSTSAANAQIDKFYAAHLNHLISENISFVDLKFDVQSFRDYNTSGEQVLQRNYYYNIGKSFMNDRARINYKGSLGTTSDQQAEQVNSHFVQNELEIEMKIDKLGNLKGVFFRKNKYEGLLEGEVIETGGGIRYSKDFYSLWDMFTNDKRQEEKEKSQQTNHK